MSGSGGTPAAGSGGVGGDASGSGGSNGGNGGTTSSGGGAGANGGSAGSNGGSAGANGGSAGSNGGSAGSNGGSAGSNGGSAGSAGANGGTGGSGGTTYLVTVVKNGTGTVTSSVAGIDCGATCSASFPAGALTLHAHPSNGSGYRFAGWSGACSGLAQDCSLTVAGDLTATATFVPVTQNLVFVTSDVFAPNLGSAAAYDAKCNAAATTAGINNVAGSSYIAYTSDANSLAKDRLKTARGWVRMDGKPFADTQASLFTKGAVFYPIEFDETGATPSNVRPAMTGAASDGSLSSQTPTGNCNDFKSADVTDYVVAGASDGGPSTWSSIFAVSCNNSSALICMGKDLQVAAAPTPVTGKYIWLTDAPFVIGNGTPNDFCKSVLPAGVTNAAALISSSGSSAASVLNASTRYVRLDGVPIGTGAQIAAGTLESGLWQTGTAHYNDAIAWTGATDFGSAGTVASTCSNWTAPGSSDNPTLVPVGESGELRTWWYDVTGPCNSEFIYLYCAQTAP
jgi:hypothetical protein